MTLWIAQKNVCFDKSNKWAVQFLDLFKLFVIKIDIVCVYNANPKLLIAWR